MYECACLCFVCVFVHVCKMSDCSGQLFVRPPADSDESSTPPTPSASAFGAQTVATITSAIRSPSLSSLKSLRDTLMRSDSQPQTTPVTPLTEATAPSSPQKILNAGMYFAMRCHIFSECRTFHQVQFDAYVMYVGVGVIVYHVCPNAFLLKIPLSDGRSRLRPLKHH